MYRHCLYCWNRNKLNNTICTKTIGNDAMTPDILRQLIRNLPPLDEDAKPFTWTHHRQALRDKILNSSPAEFLTWPTIRGTMFVGDNEHTRQRYQAVMSSKNNGWFKDAAWLGLREHPFGKPALLPYNKEVSGNTVSQVHHLLQTDINPTALRSVVEIGGGFGAMAAVFARMGFNGTYTIIDLPEFSALQRYYLANVAADLNTVFISDAPKWADVNQRLNVKVDLLMGFHSLSEIDDLGLRAALLNSVQPRVYIIVSQPSFFGVDNCDWFNWYASTRPEYDWRVWDNPTQPGHFYVKGVRK